MSINVWLVTDISIQYLLRLLNLTTQKIVSVTNNKMIWQLIDLLHKRVAVRPRAPIWQCPVSEVWCEYANSIVMARFLIYFLACTQNVFSLFLFYHAIILRCSLFLQLALFMNVVVLFWCRMKYSENAQSSINIVLDFSRVEPDIRYWFSGY